MKFALVGCGRISYKHIEALKNNQDKAELVAVCDVEVARAEQRAEEYRKEIEKGDVSVYTDHAKLLAETDADAVVIATESGNHAQIALDAISAGFHVLTEKPMALSTVDMDKMIASADESGRALGVCFQNRFNEPIRALKSALDQGRFGRLFNAKIQIRWNRNEQYYEQAPWRGTWRQDGGTLMNQCTHGIDLLQWILGGNVTRVTGVTRRFQRPIQAEDFGAAIVEFDNGAVGIIEGSANVYPKNLDETLSVFGEKGTVVIGGVAVNKFLTWRFEDAAERGDTEETVVGQESVDPPTVYGFGHSALYRDFIESVEAGRKPAVSGRDGRSAVDIVLAIYKSMKEGKPVDFPFDFSSESMLGFFDAD